MISSASVVVDVMAYNSSSTFKQRILTISCRARETVDWLGLVAANTSWLLRVVFHHVLKHIFAALALPRSRGVLNAHPPRGAALVVVLL